jgi:hypothetical protein
MIELIAIGGTVGHIGVQYVYHYIKYYKKGK